MQSKVFEPLLFGKILICDPRVLSGYKFEEFIHYIPARDAKDFYEAIIWVQENPTDAVGIGRNGCILAREIIGPKMIKLEMKRALELVLTPKRNN